MFGPQPQKALTIFTERTTPLDHNKALDVRGVGAIVCCQCEYSYVKYSNNGVVKRFHLLSVPSSCWEPFS